MMQPFFAALTESLCEHLRFTVRYLTPNENDETRAERNEKFNQPTPDAPELLECALHILEWFRDLSSQRRSGPEAITWSEIKAWVELTGEQPSRDEIAAILAMDRAYRDAVHEERAEARRKNSQNTAVPSIKPTRKGRNR